MIAVTDIRLPRVCYDKLTQLGFSVLSLPPFPALDSRVASHPDMLILPIGNRLFAHREYYKIAKKEIDKLLSDTYLSLALTNDAVGSQYPNDVPLNVAVVGNRIIGRQDTMSRDLLKYATENGFSVEHTKQGYAKCSTIILGDQAIITADPAIEKTAHFLSLDVLAVSPGYVALDGYDYGFLGGASGVCGTTVYFCGDIMKHPDGERVVTFCHQHGYKTVSLSDQLLYDVGSIFFL